MAKSENSGQFFDHGEIVEWELFKRSRKKVLVVSYRDIYGEPSDGAIKHAIELSGFSVERPKYRPGLSGVALEG